MPPKRAYFEALFTYHRLALDLSGALAVREEELRILANHGRLLHECRLHVQRCQILARLGRLRSEDLETARAAIGRVRQPESYLEELEQLTVS
jgi:hypothetical protein